MTLDELLRALRDDGHPDQHLHLDVRHAAEETPDPDRFATAILNRWVGADLPNTWVVASDSAYVIAAFEAHGRVLGIEVTTLLNVSARVVSRSNDAGADGVSVPFEATGRAELASAARAGLVTAVITGDDRAALQRGSRWPTDALITDFPGDLTPFGPAD